MSISEEIKLESVILSQPAATAVRSLMEQKDLEGYALRIFVQGGGCSGLQYGLALDNNIRETDTTSETDGIQLICDEVSIQYLSGATVDYVEDVTGSGFKINNPNQFSCGCGSSTDSSGGCSGCN